MTCRIKKAENEEQRWRTIEMQHQTEQQHMDRMRENNSFARSNKTSMPYNPISLKYDDGHDGERLRYSDESLRYRGALRAEHLQRRMTSTGYDPITGEPIQRVFVPQAPIPTFTLGRGMHAPAPAPALAHFEPSPGYAPEPGPAYDSARMPM